MQEQQASYADLVASRKACSKCVSLENPSRYCGGRFDSDQIGAWTLCQGNLKSELVVVGQDWGDTSYFEKNAGRDTTNNPTNKTLRDLLLRAGVKIEMPSATDCGGGAVFFTNAILCLKQGGMQSKVDPSWFINCGTLFLRPTIELVTPKVVVTLGQQAYRAICHAYGLRQKQPFRRAVEAEGEQLPSGPLLVPVFHCGARIFVSPGIKQPQFSRFCSC